MTLVYFGSVFIYQWITGHPHISKEVLTWDTNLTVRSQIVKLKDMLEDMHAKIRDDLARLKLSKLLDSQSQGCFRKLEAQYLYVYEHNGYTECSAMKLSQFKIIGDIKDSVNLIYHLEHENEDEFLPFFYPNPVLPTLYDRIYQQRTTSSTKKRKIKECKDRVTYVTTYKKYRDDRDKCYTLDSKDYCHSEDVWTEQLASILKNVYPNAIEMTATKKGNAANDVMLTKFPKGVTLKMLLFHGCPDLIINSSPLMLIQGCIENLQGEFVPYIMSSPIPDQCGQLLACMYQLMMLQYLRQLMNGEECTQVKGQGMFIIRKSDVYLFTFFISDKGMKIVADNYTSYGNQLAMFCFIMDKFIGSITDKSTVPMNTC